MSTTVPYENATSGTKAREEITALLRRMGCEEVARLRISQTHGFVSC